MTRPLKRQRRSAGHESESQGDRVSSRSSHDSHSNPVVALSSRPKPPRARPSRAPTRIPSSSPSSSPQKASSSLHPDKPKSLHNFFQPATEGQRWSAQKFEAKRPLAPVPKTTTTLDVDEIEDDYDSYDEIFTQHLASLDATPATDAASQKSSQPRRPAPKPARKPRQKSQPTKRFIMSAGSTGSGDKPRSSQSVVELDRRPWAQRFAPSSLEELAVHKRKVGDVRNWLEEAFAGKRPQVSTDDLRLMYRHQGEYCLWGSEVRRLTSTEIISPPGPRGCWKDHNVVPSIRLTPVRRC